MGWPEGIRKQCSNVLFSKSHLRKKGRPCSLSAEEISAALEMREKGKSIRFIADEVGTSRMSVWRLLKHESNKNAPALISKELFS
ncbi:MAG: helix-turn-helix domain-containing protein [archaeon]